MRNFLHITLVVMLTMTGAPQFALAQSSEWAETLGARMRVHLEPLKEKDSWRAVLDVELEEGWNSYWLDPGYNGIPPQISVKGHSEEPIENTLVFQAPEKLGKGEYAYAGYLDHFSLGILPTDQGPFPEKFDVFLGLCSDICVPFQTSLKVNNSISESAQKLASFYVDKAFSKMPHDLGVVQAEVNQDAAKLIFPTIPSSDYSLILSELQGWKLADLKRVQGDEVHFSAKVLKQGHTPQPTAFSLVSQDRKYIYSGVIHFTSR